MNMPIYMRPSLHPAKGVRMILCADAIEACEVENEYLKRGTLGKVAFDDIHGWSFVISEVAQ